VRVEGVRVMALGSGCANHTTLGSRVQSGSMDAVRSQPQPVRWPMILGWVIGIAATGSSAG